MKKLLILFVFAATISINAQISIIANKSVSEASITVGNAGNIYSLAQTKWSDGSKIIVFANSSEAKNAFYTSIGKNQLSIKKEWMKKQLTGEAKAPETLGSDADVIAKVASTPGAIGFVKSSSVDSSVKVLLEIK